MFGTKRGIREVGANRGIDVVGLLVGLAQLEPKEVLAYLQPIDGFGIVLASRGIHAFGDDRRIGMDEVIRCV